jgi:hypothetical protein
MPQCICSCHSVVRKDVKGLSVCRSTSVQDVLWSFIERLVLEAPFRGWGDQSLFHISHAGAGGCLSVFLYLRRYRGTFSEIPH